MMDTAPRRISRNGRIVGAVVAIAIAVVCIALAFSFAGGKDPGFLGPMVQMLEDNGFVVVWRDPDHAAAEVHVSAEGAENVQVVRIEPENARFEAMVTGLAPDTVYTYEIHSEAGGQVIADGKARTSPGEGANFTFIAFGDGGTGETIQYDLAKVMGKYPADVIVNTGDLVYMEGEREDYPTKFWHPYEPILKNTAFYPTLGNHDVETDNGLPMFETFVLPANGPEGTDPERHYWFDYGNVRFVGLDSNEPFAVMQEKVAPWLDQVLAEAGDRYKVLYFHHGFYTNGKYEPSGKMKTCVEPLCDMYDVELVLVGHNHMYERTYPIREGQVVEPGHGTVYITTAAGGARLYDIDDEPMPEMAVQINDTWSFTVLDVSPERMIGRQISLDNKVIDEFEVLRAGMTADDEEAAR